MHLKASKYLAVETAMSGLVNGILNCAAAFALFHGRSRTPTTGPASLLRDSIGETFLVISLSVLVPSLIARHRRRAGTLPILEGSRPTRAGNLYIRSVVAGLIATGLFVSLNFLLLPLLFPNGVSLGNIVWFKTLYGAVLGSIATYLALRRSLNEAH